MIAPESPRMDHDKQICLLSITSDVQDIKRVNFEQLLTLASFQTTMAIRFIFFRVCPFAFTFAFAVFFIHSFHVLSGYFHVSLNLVSVPIIKFEVSDNFRDTALLKLYKFFISFLKW